MRQAHPSSLDVEGRTPFLTAASNGSLKPLIALMMWRAAPNVKPIDGSLAEVSARQRGEEWLADPIAMCARRDAKLGHSMSSMAQPTLQAVQFCRLAKRGDAQSPVTLAGGQALTDHDAFSFTPLLSYCYAIAHPARLDSERPVPSSLKWLAALGADVNQRSPLGHSDLMFTIRALFRDQGGEATLPRVVTASRDRRYTMAYRDAVKTLIDLGADPSLKDITGRTALDWATAYLRSDIANGCYKASDPAIAAFWQDLTALLDQRPEPCRTCWRPSLVCSHPR